MTTFRLAISIAVIFFFMTRCVSGQEPDKILESIEQNYERQLGTSIDSAYHTARAMQRKAADKGLPQWEAMGAYYQAQVLFYMGKIADALKHGRIATALARKAGNNKIVYRCYAFNATAYSGMGMHAQALEAQMDCVNLAEKMKDKKLLRIAYGNLGILYAQQESYDKALDAGIKAFNMALEENDAAVARHMATVLAQVYLKKHSYGEAEAFAGRAMELSKEIGDKQGEIEANRLLGEIATENLKPTAAAIYFQNALVTAKEIGSKGDEATILLAIAEAGMKAKKYATSIAKAKQAVSLATEMGLVDVLKNGYSILTRAYAASGNETEKQHYATLEKNIEDSLRDEEAERLGTMNKMDSAFRAEQVIQRQRKLEEQKKKLEDNVHTRKNMLWFGLLGAIVATGIIVLILIRKSNNRIH